MPTSSRPARDGRPFPETPARETPVPPALKRRGMGSDPSRTPDPGPTPGRPETQAVRGMFDRIAPRYDRLNRLLSLGTDMRWRRRAVDALGLAPGARLLDACTGTADILVEWLRRDAGNRGVGLDLSLPMLRLGRVKGFRRSVRGRTPLVAGDVSALPLADEQFDGALVAFGLRNVLDRSRALAQLRRVLRPGAPLIVLEFGRPRGALGWVYSWYFEAILPRLGALLGGHLPAYTYLPASVARFPRVEDFALELTEAGFDRVSWQPLTHGIAWICRGVKGGRPSSRSTPAGGPKDLSAPPPGQGVVESA
jgi:demethylmenaquinone methyltransferase/2-methoxy-6-polyprenyl-1,4-benzoquinol methylase